MKQIFIWNRSFTINLKSAIAILIAFILLILYHRHLTFTDETDNMLGAISVAHGKDIYSGFISQHTPFVYYFFSLFALIGVRDYETFRLCMCLTILLFWLVIYFCYRQHFGEKVILILIYLYVLTIPLHWGNMILSDVFEGFCLLILLMSFIKYWYTKKIELIDCILISISIFISIMSAFVSVYPIFIIVTGFTFHEIYYNKTVIDYKIKLKSYVRLIGIISIPFVILFFWYLITNNLHNFYFQAYAFNRIFYSKYSDGFGGSAISIFIQLPSQWIKHIATNIINFTTKDLISPILLIFILIYSFDLFKKNKILAIILFVFIGFTGIRGYTGFHAIPYFIVSFFCVGHVLNQYIFNKEMVINEFKRTIIQIFTFLLFLSSLNSYLPSVGENFLKPKGYMDKYYYDDYTLKLTEPSDKVWYSNLGVQSYIRNHREPASRSYAIVPWYADAYSDLIIEDLKKNKPKMIVFEKDNEVWGLKYVDFASKIYNFIQQNYKILNPNDHTENNIYILNEYYDEANKKLWDNVENFGLKNGMLVKDSQGKIYMIEGNEKRHILSPKAFDANKFNWNDVKKIEDSILLKIKTGKPIE